MFLVGVRYSDTRRWFYTYRKRFPLPFPEGVCIQWGMGGPELWASWYCCCDTDCRWRVGSKWRSVPACLLQTSSFLRSTSSVQLLWPPSHPVAMKYGQRRIGLFSGCRNIFHSVDVSNRTIVKTKKKWKKSCLILNHLAIRKKISEMPGLILIFQCEVRIFITFSPFLLARDYTLGSHSTCFSLPLVEGLAAPSRAQCCTDSIKY